MTDARDGQVITFYSYKGGTGRTMALANVAWILAANGYRVLAVDWDLESPGLHRFFAPFIDRAALDSTRGVIELIREYEWATTRRHRAQPALARGLRPGAQVLVLAELALPERRVPRLPVRRPAEQRLRQHRRRDELGRLLRPAGRRPVLRRAARRHEEALRLHPDRQPHRPLATSPRSARSTCRTPWSPASPSASRASTAPRRSPARSSTGTARGTSGRCRCRCASTGPRSSRRTPGGWSRGNASPGCRPG